ncbi:MAG TPA: metallophosphoesterase family protein [Gaiellales bacterium]|nr:metallophosphoesterase family protein [Gaiellales bacterium]
MRIAVLSDVHANLAALEAVLDAVEQEQVDELWSLGDVVGYGPQPSACLALIGSRCSLCLAGNHDLVVAGVIDLDVFAHDAGTAARWTAEVLTDEERQTLASGSPAGERDGVEVYHGSIRDPIWEYVLDDRTASVCLDLQRHSVALIGHSHLPVVFGYDGDQFYSGMAPADSLLELSGGRALLNPGSVGQPRDGDPRAAFMLLDTDAATAVWRRVDYDIRRTQAEIREAGLPARLGARLAEGR